MSKPGSSELLLQCEEGIRQHRLMTDLLCRRPLRHLPEQR